MSSGGRESPVDHDGARERSGRRRETKQTLTEFGLPSTDQHSSDGAIHPAETESRSSTPEIVTLDATSANVASAHDDPLPFPSLPGTWRNLSIIFEGSESTHSLSNEDVLSNKSAPTSAVDQSNHVANTKRFKDKTRYSLPDISSFVSKSSKSTGSTKTSVADKIAYFEESLRNGKETSTASPPLKSFWPIPLESRRRSLPSVLNAPSTASPSSVPFPTRPSHSEESDLGTKLYTGFLWYLNVHGPGPPNWILCNASLYRTALLLTWQTSGITRATVTLDLLNCLDVQSTPTVSDPSVASDVGAIAWSWERERVSRAVEDIYPMHLQFDDGVERIATSALIDRVTWVGMLLEFLPLNPSRRHQVATPRKRVLSPLPDSSSIATITLSQETRGTATAAATIPSPNALRPTNGHNRTRSAGDVPKAPIISKEMQRKPLIRRISSMSNILSLDSSTPSELGCVYITANESSTMSSVPSRRRSVSLKSVTSFLSRRSSRMDDLSSDGSEPTAPVSPVPTRSRLLLHSRSGSQESASVASEEAEGNSLGRLFRKRDASAPARLKKPKPRLPALARLTIDPHRTFSDGQIRTKAEETVSASSTMQDLGDYSHSPTYHSAVTSLPSTPQYHTASEGNGRGEESTHWSSAQGHTQLPSSTSDSLFVTASNFTSSDAWMAHFSAASRPTSPKAPSSRRRRNSGSSTPGTMSSSHTFSHLFNVGSVPLPALTADNSSSIASTAADFGSTRLTTVPTTQNSASSVDATLGNPITQAEASTILIDELSSEMGPERVDYPTVPPPSIDNLPPTSLLFFSDAISSLRTNSTLGVAATASALASPSDILTQTLPNDISTQLDITTSVQEVLPAARFSLLRDGDAEYEMTLMPSTYPSTPSIAREPQPLPPSEASSRRRLIPKRVGLRQKSDPSLRSRQLSICAVTPNTPSSVEVSLTPVQASVFPSIIDTVESNGLDKDENTCEQRLNHLLEFVERTRAAQTETSAEFSEQLGRIENQLLELGRLIRERMASAWTETGADNLRAIKTKERARPTSHWRLLHSPTIISLSPPLSAFYDDTTPTSAELPASITHSEVSNDDSTLPRLRFEPRTSRPAGDTSSSLHLSQFPEVPTIPPQRLLSITGAAHTVFNIELRDMIERLSRSIDALVTRQQVFNDALEGLQRTGVALEPRPLSGETEGENNTSNISPRWTELLKSLENFARRQRAGHPDQAHDNFHHFLDISSARTSPSHTEDVEILPALPVPTGAISLAYAHKLPAPRRRSQSLLPAVNSEDVASSSKESSPRPRARSADNVVTMTEEPNDAAERNSIESLENDTLGSLVRAPFITRHHVPITRTWYRKPKNDRTHVHWATSPETTTDNLPPAGAEGDTGTDSGAAQVTRLLQESRTRQEAASTQQNEIVRYLGELNDWLSTDAIDRRAELRGLGDRLDGIQRTMMYGPAPAISLAVPLRPLPLFTALSEQSSEHDAWPRAQNDEEPIIPPLPPRPGNKPKGDQGPTILSAAALDSPHGREEGPTSILEIPSSVVPLSTSRRSAGQRVTFATPSQDLPAVTHPGGFPTAASSIIKVSGNTIVSQPDTRSLSDVDDGMADQQSPIKDRRRSRSRAMKPLAREIPEIVVNIPGVRRQGNSTPKLLSSNPAPHHATAYRPLNTASETGRPRHPVATVIPSNYRDDSRKASSPVPQHHTIRSDTGHTIPHTARATIRPGFVEGRGGSRDREAIRRPNSLPRNQRRRSRNIRYHDNNFARRSSRSPEHAIRPGDHSLEPNNFRGSSSTPEPSTKQESRRRKPRRSRSGSPSHRTISPGHRQSSLRDANPPILSPLPLHRGRPLPPILTEPTVVDLHQSQRYRPENSRHAGQSNGSRSHTPHSPRVLHRRVPAPVVCEHPDRRSDSWAQTTSQPDRFSIVSPEVRQRMSRVITRDRTLEPSSEVTGPSAIGTIVHPFSAHPVREAVSHQQSQPAVSATVTQPRVPKPHGARAEGHIQQQTVPLSSREFGSKSSVVPNEVQISGMESLKNVGVAGTTATHDTARSAPTQVHQGHAMPKRGKRRKQAENRLSAISEKSEPQLPPSPSFEIVVESDQETARSDSDSSEQARDTIFLAHQEERQRILDQAARVQILAHEKLIHDLHDPNPTKACQNGLETGTRDKAHTREFAQTPPSSATNAIIIVSTNSRPEKGTGRSLGDTQVTRTGGTPSLALRRSPGIIANDDQDVAHLQPATRPLPSTSRVTEGIRSAHSSRIGQILQSLENERSPAPVDPYYLELENERAKARRLEEEIQKTKDAIQAIKDERAAANEKRRLDTLTSISQMQDEMRGQLQTITEQLRLNQNNPGVRTGEVPSTSFENDIVEFVNRLHDGQSAERHSNAQDRSVAETRSALAQDVERLRQSNEAQKVLIEDMLGKTTKENRRQQGLLLEAFKRASTEQVKANVNEQLHEFTGVMTHEVRILLKEVGNLREQRRNLQHEIGCLLCFRSKMEPGGEFDASWNPTPGPPCTHFPSPGADGVPHQKAPGFVGSALPAGPNAPNVPVASSSRRTTAGNHNASPVQPVVTSAPPAYAMPRTNNRGAQARAPRATNPTAVGTIQGNGESSASRPAPGRASRKSRPERRE